MMAASCSAGWLAAAAFEVIDQQGVIMSQSPQLNLEVAVSSDGSSTLTVPLLRGSVPLARMLEQRLGLVPEFKRLAVSPFLGRVRFKCVPPLSENEVVERLKEVLPGVAVEVDVYPFAERSMEHEGLEHLSRGSKTLYKMARGAAGAMQRASQGQLDIRFLAPAAFMAFAAFKLRTNRAQSTPWWIASGYFAYTLFRDLNRPQER